MQAAGNWINATMMMMMMTMTIRLLEEIYFRIPMPRHH
jgi:hypothetical protein